MTDNPRFKHLFDLAGKPRVWTSDSPHYYGLLRIKGPHSTDLGGEGLMKAFRANEREIAITYAKGQRDLAIHEGFKLKLVKLIPEEYIPQVQSSTGGSHASCDHPSTPAARRECRARRKAGLI